MDTSTPDNNPTSAAAAVSSPLSGQGHATVTNESPVKVTSPKLKKVKATTNDGRQAMLTLSSTVTFDSITLQLSRELNVPINRLKIKYGFPPKLLQAPADGKKDAVLPIQHGDRLSVEILPDPDQGMLLESTACFCDSLKIHM